jgi:predicted small integral membrane protein
MEPDVVRLCQTVFVFWIGLFAASVVLNNLTDYGTNHAFVRHVMTMDTVRPDCRLTWRRIRSPLVHHLAYAFIILVEAATAALCLHGAWAMWAAIDADAVIFAGAKATAFAGLGVGFSLWFGIFMVGAGQWFASWQSQQWSGQDAAFRFYVPIGLVFLALMHPV